MADRYPLEPSAEEMRDMARRATERVVAHIECLPDAPAAAIEGAAELAAAVREAAPPEDGAELEALLAHVFERLTPMSFNNPGPGFMAYIPGGGLYAAALADFIADAINRYVTVWIAAPGLVELESDVIRWLCRMVGYPRAAGGYLSTGGSLANFTALFTARRERLPDDFLDGRIYVSDQVHHSVERAAALAGFPGSAVARVPADASWRLPVDRLAAAVERDRAAGRRPFLVVASAGTTNTGAVDDLAALAALAAREGLWLHVDAAYGGFFLLTERGRRRLAGIERADSVTLDPHKGLFLPYGTGCLLVRDGAALERAHSVQADYMPPLQEGPDRVDFCDISPELSRDFRGLRVWLPLKLHGLAAFRAALDEKLDLARWAHAELAQIPGIEIVAPPELSVVAFRLELSGVGAADAERWNRELLERINARKRVFLTGTVLAGRFVSRICVLNFRTHRDRLEMCLEDVRAAVAEIAALARGAPAPGPRSASSQRRG